MLNKVALISDIQGNFTALQHVFAHFESEGVEQVICLGDVASGPYPQEVLKLLRQKQTLVIKGNMDDTILNPRRHLSDEIETQHYDDIDLWCSQQLSDVDKAYIRSFHPIFTINLTDNKNLLCFHGSPYSYNSVIDETLSDAQLEQLLDGYTEDIMATGHMHHPFLRKYEQSWIINPGSVGLPRKQNEKHPLFAEYALVAIEDGQLQIDFRQVAIDPDEFKEGIRKSGMPHTEWFLSQWQLP